MSGKDIVEEARASLVKDTKSLRDWLDYLERDIANTGGVISAVVLLSISETCTKLIYNAGKLNGVTLTDSRQVSPKG